VRDQLEALIQQMVEKGIRYDAVVQDFEKCYISRVLERVKGNQSRAARTLGMHRNTLSRKIAEYSLTTDFRRPQESPALQRGLTTTTRPIGRAFEPVPAANRTVAGRPMEPLARVQGRR
jgi:Fis family transcriptional regulator, factor for inversion stimulation protein